MSTLIDFYHLTMHRLLRHAPVEMASALGGMLVRANVRLNRPNIIAGAARNLKRHRPELSSHEINAMTWRFLDNVGRHMAECSLINRIAEQGRVEMIGHGPMQKLLGAAPMLSIHLHTGNWEIFGPALVRNHLPVATFYEPPASAAQSRIIENVRKEAGFSLLTPDVRGLREALSRLGNNGLVSIACDEARAGLLMAPLFGRRPHDKGNLAIAARLARRTGAHIVIAHCERMANCRFRLHITEPFTLPDDGGGLLEDVRVLNARIEPIILANLDQWYFLDDRIEEIT